MPPDNKDLVKCIILHFYTVWLISNRIFYAFRVPQQAFRDLSRKNPVSMVRYYITSMRLRRNSLRQLLRFLKQM